MFNFWGFKRVNKLTHHVRLARNRLGIERGRRQGVAAFLSVEIASVRSILLLVIGLSTPAGCRAGGTVRLVAAAPGAYKKARRSEPDKG